MNEIELSPLVPAEPTRLAVPVDALDGLVRLLGGHIDEVAPVIAGEPTRVGRRGAQ